VEPRRSDFEEDDDYETEKFSYQRATQHVKLTSEKLASLAASCPQVTEKFCRAEELFHSDSDSSCSKTGDCKPAFDGEKWTCQVGGNAHCLQSNRCLSRGECTYNKEDGSCEAQSTRDCSRTEECESDGICRWNRRDGVCEEGGQPDPARGGTCQALAQCACDLYNAIEHHHTSWANACLRAEARAARGEQSCGPELKGIRKWVRRNGEDAEIDIPGACY
jgi:hypothetical protein